MQDRRLTSHEHMFADQTPPRHDALVGALVSDGDRWFITSADGDLDYAMTPAAPARHDAW
jgi:hypothetical protein